MGLFEVSMHLKTFKINHTTVKSLFNWFKPIERGNSKMEVEMNVK